MTTDRRERALRRAHGALRSERRRRRDGHRRGERARVAVEVEQRPEIIFFRLRPRDRDRVRFSVAVEVAHDAELEHHARRRDERLAGERPARGVRGRRGRRDLDLRLGGVVARVGRLGDLAFARLARDRVRDVGMVVSASLASRGGDREDTGQS